MREFTVLEASEVLGVEKQSLHSILRTSNALKTRKKDINGIPTLLIKGETLKKFAEAKRARLLESLNKMHMELLEEEEEK